MPCRRLWENVLSHLTDNAFDKPICEVMLNQKYFNGIGNYLRAEILHRLQIPPFVQARPILEALKHPHQDSDVSLSKKIKIKKENPDLLQLCNLVPLEVIKLGGKGYDPEQSNDYSVFVKWLRCYFVPGMNSLRDHNGRTIWFQGDPGPLAPKGQKAKKKFPSIGTKRKPVKVEKTEVKRSVKKILLKKEDTEIKHEENAVKVTVKRRVKRTGDKMENGKRGRKTSSDRSTALDTDSPAQKGGNNTPAVKTRPQRHKSSTTPISIDSPKPKMRELRKIAGRQRTTKRKS
ncbi:endonuclease 8-like 1 [Bombina bombina]|uniref:endonuclease 8-like 1 n=1 Tax=Bombina bombina TaxID=8345 RepID=UPI00235A7284|nr:endonuclease 8-like 1 [Bombina bombina]